jgi:hypothetical protein
MRNAIRAATSTTLGSTLTIGAVWLVLSVLVMLEWGLWPRTALGWSIVMVAGPIAWLGIEILGELLMTLIARLPGVRHSREWIAARTVTKQFSWLRVGVLFVGSLPIVIAVIVLVAYVGPAWPAGLEQFVARHFR